LLPGGLDEDLFCFAQRPEGVDHVAAHVAVERHLMGLEHEDAGLLAEDAARLRPVHLEVGRRGRFPLVKR
jgi:hypothetical protein